MNVADIDINSLPETLAHQMYPFWQAYNRPYPPALTWRQLRAEGFTPKEWTTCGMAEIEESYDECIGYRLDEDGFVTPINGDERATWKDRLINKWTRRREWAI